MSDGNEILGLLLEAYESVKTESAHRRAMKTNSVYEFVRDNWDSIDTMRKLEASWGDIAKTIEKSGLLGVYVGKIERGSISSPYHYILKRREKRKMSLEQSSERSKQVVVCSPNNVNEIVSGGGNIEAAPNALVANTPAMPRQRQTPEQHQAAVNQAFGIKPPSCKQNIEFSEESPEEAEARRRKFMWKLVDERYFYEVDTKPGEELKNGPPPEWDGVSKVYDKGTFIDKDNNLIKVDRVIQKNWREPS